MTVREWLECTDPQKMLRVVDDSGGRRKAMLYAFACCLQCWHLMTDERVRRATLLMGRYADGLASIEELCEASADIWDAYDLDDEATHQRPDGLTAWMACAGARAMRAGNYSPIIANQTGFIALLVAEAEVRAVGQEAERLGQCRLVREIFGNPFRPVAINSAWQTPTVCALAQAAYDNRILPAGTLDPGHLAVLADALEEVGCDNADMLNHLRQPGDHVFGCWVLDLVLGKS